jgi:exonuclease VII large subunit
MSNFRSQLQVEHWMLAQMSHYPPPPPPDQQHYSPLYPTSAGTPQLLDHSQQNQLQFSNLNQPAYPKIEANTPVGQDSPQIHNLAQELQKHAAQEEHQRQQNYQANQRLQHQAQHQPQQFQAQQAPVQPDVSSDSQQPQKTNRLRKACDSCSIRKVKVCCSIWICFVFLIEVIANVHSVTRVVLHAVPAQHLTSHAHSSVRVAEEALPIAMLRLSSAGDSKNRTAEARFLALQHLLHQLTPHKHLPRSRLIHQTSKYQQRASAQSKRSTS